MYRASQTLCRQFTIASASQAYNFLCIDTNMLASTVMDINMCNTTCLYSWPAQSWAALSLCCLCMLALYLPNMLPYHTAVTAGYVRLITLKYKLSRHQSLTSYMHAWTTTRCIWYKLHMFLVMYYSSYVLLAGLTWTRKC